MHSYLQVLQRIRLIVVALIDARATLPLVLIIKSFAEFTKIIISSSIFFYLLKMVIQFLKKSSLFNLSKMHSAYFCMHIIIFHFIVSLRFNNRTQFFQRLCKLWWCVNWRVATENDEATAAFI